MRDVYEVLQVSPNAEPEVIDAAYRRLARKYHPDTSARPDAHSRMQEINWAYELLKDPRKRSRYDASRQTTRQSSTPDGSSADEGPFGSSPYRSPRETDYSPPVAQPVRPVERSALRRYWPVAALAVVAYLALTRASDGGPPQEPAAGGSGLRQSTQTDPYASCLAWTEAGLHDGETVCILGRIMVVTYQFVAEAGQDMWTAEFSFDPEHGFSLISVGEDISEWEGRCVAVYGDLFDRSLIKDYATTPQPSMITSDPFLRRGFSITEARNSLCP